jgi:hypothetical protein
MYWKASATSHGSGTVLRMRKLAMRFGGHRLTLRLPILLAARRQRPPSKRARLPTPVPTKAGPMPTNERLWTDDRDDLQNRRKPSIQLDKEYAIAVRKPDTPVHYPAQHNHLVPERSIFGFKLARRLKWRDQDVKDKV